MKTLQKAGICRSRVDLAESIAELADCRKTIQYLLRDIRVDEVLTSVSTLAKKFKFSDASGNLEVCTLPHERTVGDFLFCAYCKRPNYDDETWQAFNSVKVGDRVNIMLQGRPKTLFGRSLEYDLMDLGPSKKPE